MNTLFFFFIKEYLQSMLWGTVREINNTIFNTTSSTQGGQLKQFSILLLKSFLLNIIRVLSQTIKLETYSNIVYGLLGELK